MKNKSSRRLGMTALKSLIFERKSRRERGLFDGAVKERKEKNRKNFFRLDKWRPGFS